MPTRPQKRKPADDDEAGNSSDGNDGKRPKGDDGEPILSLAARLQATEAYFDRFRAAYEGKDTAPLGSDGPVPGQKRVSLSSFPCC